MLHELEKMEKKYSAAELGKNCGKKKSMKTRCVLRKR